MVVGIPETKEAGALANGYRVGPHPNPEPFVCGVRRDSDLQNEADEKLNPQKPLYHRGDVF